MSGKTIHLRIYGLAVLMLCSFALVSSTRGQGTLPIVAIHDSELTRALASMPATGSTPTGPGQRAINGGRPIGPIMSCRIR